MGREFYISHDSQNQGCGGTGWIMVSTQNNCFYERGASNKPAFFYAKGDSAGTSWGACFTCAD